MGAYDLDSVYGEYPGRRRGRRNRNQTDNRQTVLEQMYRRILGELAMNRFEWKGFEETGVDPRYLEMMLYFKALAVVFQDTKVINPADGTVVKVGTDQIFALMASPSGNMNLTGNYTAFTLTGPGWQGTRRSIRDCVPVWANYFRVPDLDIVNVYAWKLAQLDRTIEINSQNARRSKILTVGENGRLTAANINDMLDRGESVIPVSMELGEMITALDLGVDPRTLEPLSILRSRIWNEAMGLLGINNSNQDKKERLVSAEVGANDDQVGSARRVNLNARQDAARQINDMFGLEVSVDYYSGMPTETVNPITVEETGTGA